MSRIHWTWLGGLGLVVAVVLVGLLVIGPTSRGIRTCACNDTAGPSNLQTALSGANTYYSENHDSYLGLDVGNFETTTDLSAVGGSETSSDPNIISIYSPSATTLVLTGFWRGHNVCLGILSVTRPLSRPYFPAYPITAEVGTFYFLASSAFDCAAASVEPAPVTKGQVGLRPAGFGQLAGGG